VIDSHGAQPAPSVERSAPSAAYRALSVLLLVALPVFVLFLGANTIWEANEAYYVETPRQMVLSGDYVTPTFNDVPRLNKPVLSYWIVAGLYRLFGVSVTVERAGIALGALGLVAVTFVIGRAIGSTLTGVLAALIFASAPRVVMHARRIFIDMYIALFVALALAAFILAERQPERRRRYLILMYVAIGLGVLTKGPIGLVLPAAVIAVWLATERRLGDIRRLMILPGVLIVGAIVAPWYAALYQAHGWDPIWSFLGVENVERYLQPMAPGRGPGYYLPVLLGELFPWAPLVVLPLATAWRRTTADAPGPAFRRLLWCWVVVIVAIFSMSRTKLDLYIFPAMPAVAVLIADGLVRTAFGRDSRAVRVGLGTLGIVTALLGGAVWFVFRSGYFALVHAAPVAVLLIASGLAAVAWLGRGRGAAAVSSLAAGLIAFNYLLAGWVLPDVERLKPAPVFARKFHDAHAPDAKIGAYGEVMPSLVFYLDRPIEIIGSLEQAVSFFRDGPEAWITIRQSEWPKLQPLVPALCVAAHHPAFEAQADDLIRGSPPPEILFVTNRCG
jgi:4-amino-4-deoxy-L-arabinose transferase-like glycosyltransferase